MVEFWNAREPAWIVAGTILLSVFVHVGALMVAGTVDVAFSVEPPSLTEVELLAPEPSLEPPAVPVPPPEPESVAPPTPKPAPPKARLEPEPEPQPQPNEDPAPLKETVADFSNMTLTNERASNWQIEPSSGEESDAPIAGPGVNTGRSVDGRLDGTRDGQGQGKALPLADLGRHPQQARGLDALVEKHYPPTLKRQGVEGIARVRIRIGADGQLSVLRVLSASDPLFGEACKRSLRESPPWEPALDKGGNPAITEAPFKCEYIVR